MYRWLEELELKHVELKRCIKTFHKMAEAWMLAAIKSTSNGEAAFARRQSDMFLGLRDDANEWLTKKGVKCLIDSSDSDAIQILRDFRTQELGWLYEAAQVSHSSSSTFINPFSST